MRTISIDIYKFDELDQQTQNKVLERHREINVEHNWWDFVLADYQENLADQGFFNAEISFRGFWSQGDGCSFKADIDIDKLLPVKYQALNHNCELSVYFERYHGYSSYSIHHIRTDFYTERDNVKELEDLHKCFESWLEEYYKGLCFAIYRDLEAEYESLISDEAVRNALIDGEYEFKENGELI
jgi:hypothetical protein